MRREGRREGGRERWDMAVQVFAAKRREAEEGRQEGGEKE